MSLCATPDQNNVVIVNTQPVGSCTGVILMDAADYNASIGTFTYDNAAMELGLGGMLLLFTTGVGIGLVLAQVRKLRI